MEKEININNEEQILKECDFDYLYNSEKCSRELCKFYNDIILTANKKQGEYDVNRAFIDLCRIAITLNKQSARIKELESKLRVSNNQLASSELKYNELEKNYKKQENLLSTYLKNCSELNLENQLLKQQMKEKDKVIDMQKSIQRYDIGDMLVENTKLKQSQNEKAIEVLEKVRNYFVEKSIDGDEIETGDRVITKDIGEVADFIDNQIKLLGGKNEYKRISYKNRQ